MKKILLLSAFVAALFASCSKDDSTLFVCGDGDGCADELVSPLLRATVNSPENPQSPMTGVLEVYPCQDKSSIYYGNYVNNNRTSFPGLYALKDGEIFGDDNRVISLPVGTYNMVYWGTPKYDEPIHNAPQIVSPGLTAGADVSKLYFSLRSIGDGIYSPVYDLVHAVKTAHIGTDALETSLTRVGSGLKVIVKQSDGSVFIPEIASIKVNIGGIAEKINFYTGEAENLTKTVQFELTRSEDGLTYENSTVMLFPSAENPPLELLITLYDGTEFKLTQNLNTTLSPNTRLTLNISIGKILPDGNPGDFTYDDWNESSENIDFPIVD